MQRRIPWGLLTLFTQSAAVIFMFTAVGKLVASGGCARILDLPDPVFLISTRRVLQAAALIELVVAVLCFSSRAPRLNLGLICWLSVDFVLYRIGLGLVGYRNPCQCLGALTDSLNVSAESADIISKIILSYLLFGSCLALAWFRVYSSPADDFRPSRNDPAVTV